MKNRNLLFKRFWLIVVAAVLYCNTSIIGQTVDTTGVFDTPLTGNKIVHAELVFHDVDADGVYDASFVLSQPEIVGWGDYSASLAFYPNLQIRNGGSGFVNTNNVALVPGQKYDAWFDLNITNMTYRVYVQTTGMELPVEIFTQDAGFRNTSITSIDRWSCLHNADTEPDTVQVLSVTVGDVPEGYDDYSLKTLTFDKGVISPELNLQEIAEYDLLVPFGTTSVNISATVNGLGAKIEGDIGEVTLVNGSYKASILVTAGTGDMVEYVIKITEDVGTTDATLKDIELSVGALNPVLNPSVDTYELIVPKGTTSVNVVGVTNVPEATVVGNGSFTLSGGVGTATLTVTAKDNQTVKTYTINIAEADGKNYSLYLPGVSGINSNVNLSGLNLTTLPFTIEMWIKPEGDQVNNAGLIYNRPGNFGLQYASSWQAAESIRMMTGTTYVDGNSDYGIVSSNVPFDNWHHIALVLTEDTRTFYLDGVPKTDSAVNVSMSGVFAAIDFSAGDTYLGWDTNNGQTAGTAFKGNIDDVRIWNVAKDSATLAANKLTSLVGNEAGLIGFWNFDLQNPSQAVDLSINKLHGLISGGSYGPSISLDDATLSGITTSYGGLDPVFNADTLEYTVVIPQGKTEVVISATTTSPLATISMDDTITISNGTGIATIVVTSYDLTSTKTYTVNFTEYSGELILKHSYDFWSGDAKDKVGGANGVVVGGSVYDGRYRSSVNGDYIELPGDKINLGIYPAITLEAFITATGENIGKYTMLAYFGDINGANSYWIQPTRNDSTMTSRTQASDSTATGIEIDMADDKYHVVSTLTYDSIAYYINGILQNKIEAIGLVNKISSANAFLGKSGWSADDTWMGYLHEFNIYSGAMNSTEVETRAAHYFSTVSVDGKSVEQTISVYPTVTNGQFNVCVSGAEGIVTVYNLAGNIVIQEKVSKEVTPVLVKQAGIYMIRVECDGKTELFKVVKN
ncbi:MAG: T9SS type A sorting domain-containing protein [Marinilabiliaceae bacterium]|nr:T9SS type A sorting domain-containing protein [Marinilabiliaceae bacterium]